MRVALLGSVLVLALAACDSKSDSPSDSPAKAPAKPDAGKADAGKADAGKAEPSQADDGGAPAAAGPKLEFSTSAGPGLTGVAASECTIGADGKGVVKADDGKFELTFEGSVGKLKWTHDGGVLETETTVMVTGKALRFSGVDSSGAGHDGEITCP